MTGVARRRVMGLVLALCAVPVLSRADDRAPAPAEWQATITTQIEAFRNADAATAFSMAAKPFRTSFPNAESFYFTIVHSGYAAIALSVGHSFGDFRLVDEAHVEQQVRLVGQDQSLYTARYVLGREPDGWRVEAVGLKDERAIGV